ncbi:hypothetical protein M501DRAFT_1012985 [Patellaria atrata CBS 101060]|uniref:Zinc finger PHD-type domain-containing protein n=1 Tax=Patellaria atrata CBS 101060 TaxID=1346257 RepID=A0A9P4VTY2_9PEZI|nr:hypothetical protein M501DRAFT_1012985 [Patellaria atrata CBS 101060]
MNLDQSIYSDWHIPSPSSTPTSATFSQTSTRTPKCEPAPTYFLDAFGTPRAQVHPTLTQASAFNQASPFTPKRITKRPSTSRLNDPEFHVNYLSPHNGEPLPPVEPAHRLSSSETAAGLQESSTLPGPAKTPRKLLPNTMEGTQMQTPPPTRHSSERGKDQSQSRSLATPTTTIPGRITTPTSAGFFTENNVFNQTPLQISSLQFSPDVSRLMDNGPATAPAYSQSRFSWDTNTTTPFLDVEMSNTTHDDPFVATNQNSQTSSEWLNDTTTGSFSSSRHQAGDGLDNEDTYWLSSPTTSQGVSAPSRPTSFMSTSSGVDPSMLFSFSDNVDTSIISPGKIQRPESKEVHMNRQPYEHQTRESLREKEMARKARQHHSRSSTNSSSSSMVNIRPGPQRSNTDAGISKRHSMTDSLSISQSLGFGHIPRRSSPLKRASRASLTSIPETSSFRSRTRLVVDESGHARTETIPPPIDNPRAHSRQSGLWDEDGNDTDSDTSIHIANQHSSFTIPNKDSHRLNHFRLDNGPNRSNSSRLSRPSSSTSLRSIHNSARKGLGNLLEQPSTTRTENANAFRRHSMINFNSFTSEGDGIPSQDFSFTSNSGDNAQFALKKLKEDRAKVQQQKEQHEAQGTLFAHNQRWARASADLAQLGPRQQLPFEPFSHSNTISPMSMIEHDISTPTTDRSSLSTESTRCVCNSVDGGGMMIQCESCVKWLHGKCVGITEQNIPPVYVCIFCTGQTPAVRGGRIRKPIRAVPNYTSPLNHKSGFRR